MNFSRIFLLIFVLLAIKPLCAQDLLGIMNSSYAGINGSVINPAVTVTSPYYVDINLITGNFFAENNYIYIAKEDYRFSRFFETDPQFPTHEPGNMIVYDYYNTKDKKGFAGNRFLGPSVAVTVGSHAFGIVTGERTFTSTKNVPYDVAKFAFERREFPPQYNINYVSDKNIYNAEMAWAEMGFNYSYIIHNESTDYWAAGITLKNLRGYGGAYLFTTNTDYLIPDNNTLIINNLKAEAGYSLPLDYETNEYVNDPLFRGKGLGMDIGVIYQKKKRYEPAEASNKLCSQNYIPYHYKIGISLLDIGGIKFTQNAEKLVFDNVSTVWPNINSVYYTSVNDLTELLSNQFYGNPTELKQGNEIKIALPTALSIQFDWNYTKNWFINTTMVLPLQLTKSGLRRPGLLAVTPRYETALFDVSMPVSLFDWTKPRVGLSARFLWFFIGTEKISGFFSYKDFTGLDFYFGAKISLRKGFCRNKAVDNCGIEEFKMFKVKK